MNKFYTNVHLSGSTVLHRGYEDGNRVQYRHSFSPTLYVQSKSGKSEFRTVHDEPVDAVQPGNIKDCKEFVEKYKDVSGFKIYGNTGWIYQYIASLYPQHEEAEYDMKHVRVATIDIEVESENGFAPTENPTEKVNVITLGLRDKKWVFAIHEFSLPDSPNLVQNVYASEEQMLVAFMDIWQQIDADVVTGWNIRGYDIPYLVNRIAMLFPGENREKGFSPWNMIHDESVEIRGKTINTYKIPGIAILDYYELYRKYTSAQQESYKLDHIAFVELGKKKMDYSEYDNIREFYNGNFQKFVEYNVIDVDLVQELDQKLNLIELHISIAYLSKTNYEDVFSQVRTWDSTIYNNLLKKNVVIPFKEIVDKSDQYAGAYVKEPHIGMHDWVVSLDLASLYPNLVIQNNISPDTIVDEPKVSYKVTVDDLLLKKYDLSELKTHNYSLAANGQLFSKNKLGFLPELMNQFYQDRKKAKKIAIDYKKKLEVETDETKKHEYENLIAKFDTKQMALKIFLNSGYGTIGTPYFRFYDVRQAEAITLSGQLSIRWIQNKLNEFLNKALQTKGKDYVIASDTDSIYLTLAELVKTQCTNCKDKIEIVNYLSKFAEEVLTPFIEKKYKELAEYMNSYEQRMEMKREVIADRGIWKAKKMYCLNVYDSEGVRYAEPKLKIMGIEVQRSSTPKICREHLKNAIKIILTKTETDLIDYIEEFKAEFMKSSPEAVAFPRGVNNLKQYSDAASIFKKGTPIAVRGALMHNHMLETLKLKRKYNVIMDAEKVKFLYLKEPNPSGGNVISFVGQIPKEFGLHNYVDYRTQFEKTFLDPITSILDVIGWKSEKQETLDSFFG